MIFVHYFEPLFQGSRLAGQYAGAGLSPAGKDERGEIRILMFEIVQVVVPDYLPAEKVDPVVRHQADGAGA